MSAAHVHKSDAAKARCWSCSHPEILAASPEDEAYARQLIHDGWVSTSARYRTVACVDLPPLERWLVDEVPAHVWAVLQAAYAAALARQWPRTHPTKEKTLTPAQFAAFKRLGGRSA